MHTWQSQDACALSRHCELCKQSSWSRLRARQEKGLSSQQVVWAPEVPPGPHCCFMRKGLEFAPQQIPGTQSQLHGWTAGRAGEAGGRQMERLDGKIARVGIEL